MNGLVHSNASSAASNAALYAANPTFRILRPAVNKLFSGIDSCLGTNSYYIFGIIFALALSHRLNANFAIYPSA